MKNNFLADLDEMILNKVSEEGSEFLDNFLEGEGYDLNIISKVSNSTYKKQRFLLKGKLNYEKDQSLLEKVAGQFQDAIDENIDKPIAFLKGLIQNNRLAVHYRNLDKLDINDIKEIIKDQNLLEILEMLDQQEDE